MKPSVIALMLSLVGVQPLVSAAPELDPELFEDALIWREVGPYRGGRSAAVAATSGSHNTFYFGATGGGVWKTENGGKSWANVSDGFFGGSIGAVAVSEWDPNVIYVGTGEKTVRGNVSHGDGLWKSTDAGRSWHHSGLPDSRHITRIRIHPKNPDRVYAAVLGHLYGPNEERGVYRSDDGGESWQRILFVNKNAGAVDLTMDPSNPRILYASTWRILRTPWSLESGGEGSSLWKSTDGGDNWTELKGNKGLPEGIWGISGISVSGSDPDNLYAIIEAEEGGVFRSRDGGESWSRSNKQRDLRQRAWYYTRINAHPTDPEQVYVLNVRFHHSKDGGKTFSMIATPHGDNHDLWIDPSNPLRMIQANDGGANVSFDRGTTWSEQSNQPTAQMYRVSVDNAFPYRLLGGQQDNSAVRIRSRSAFGDRIGTRDWEPTAGGESGHIVAKPDDPEIVYGGSYGGFLMRVDHRTGQRRLVNVWPDNPMGWGAAELKYRFQWNFPLFFSPHNPDRLYAAANVLFYSDDEGQTWHAISGDLTRNDKSKMGPSGGPITKDNTSVEYYGTIFAAAESQHEAGVIWTGSDDGKVHVTRDGGETWSDVTPRGMPEWIQINSIEIHPYQPGGLYLAGTRYKLDDFEPYLYLTTDYGRSWKRIDRGIPRNHFTRVIRADSDLQGLLYAGTENGVYVSFDDGGYWQPLQLNLPQVPITDLALKHGDLIAATQGRGFWILDDLSMLHQLNDDFDQAEIALLAPGHAYRLGGGSSDQPGDNGRNPPSGAAIRYWLKDTAEADAELRIDILDSQDELIRSFSCKPEEDAKPKPGDEDKLLECKSGWGQLVWDLRYPPAKKFDGMVLWNRRLNGPVAVPGDYVARMHLGNKSVSTPFSVLPDPRITTSPEEYQAQFDFHQSLRDKLSETHESIGTLRKAKAQMEALSKRIAENSQLAALRKQLDGLAEQLEWIEETLYQTQMESPQDPLNYPIRLNDKLAGLMGASSFGSNPPTASMLALRDELVEAIDIELTALNEIWEQKLPEINALIREREVDFITLED